MIDAQYENLRCSNCDHKSSPHNPNEGWAVQHEACTGYPEEVKIAGDEAWTMCLVHEEDHVCTAKHEVPAVIYNDGQYHLMAGAEATEQLKAEEVADALQASPADGLAELLRDVTDPF